MAAKSNGILREALTFDDVLLQPGLSDVLPSEVDIRTRITRDDRAQHPDHLLGHGHGDRGRAWRSPWRRPAASASSTATSSREEQAAQVRQVKKFESGMVVNPLTIAPGRDARRCARADEGARHLRHSGGRGRRQRPCRQAGRHPHQPRRALCHRSAPEGRRADDQGPARHRARGRRPGRGQAPAAPAPHREAAGGRRRSIAASA